MYQTIFSNHTHHPDLHTIVHLQHGMFWDETETFAFNCKLCCSKHGTEIPFNLDARWFDDPSGLTQPWNWCESCFWKAISCSLDVIPATWLVIDMHAL